MLHFRSALPFVRGPPCAREACAPQPPGGQGQAQVARQSGAYAPAPGRHSVALAARQSGAWVQGSTGRPAHGFPRLSSDCAPLLLHLLTQYICLTRNTGYETIKPMTKYCPIFILFLTGVQQDRNIGLARNYGAAICEKSVQ